MSGLQKRAEQAPHHVRSVVVAGVIETPVRRSLQAIKDVEAEGRKGFLIEDEEP